MSREASYGKTKLNNVREDRALNILLESNASFQKPDSKTRKRILELLGVADYSSRAFDLIQTDVPVPPVTVENVHEHIDAIRLIEVKATKADIADENLHGFFFGATDNEYRLAEKLGDRYKFGFVVLPPKNRAPFFVLLTLAEVNERTSSKRIQYQVNFRGKPKP